MPADLYKWAGEVGSVLCASGIRVLEMWWSGTRGKICMKRGLIVETRKIFVFEMNPILLDM